MNSIKIRIVLLFIIFSFHGCYNQKESLTKVIVKKVMCQNEEINFVDFSPQLYKWNEEDLKFDEYGPHNNDELFTGEITYNLPKGLYEIEHYTLFWQIEKQQFHVRNNETMNVLICHDAFDHKNNRLTTFIDKLNINDSYTIEIEIYGCNHCKSTWEISRDRERYYFKSKKINKVLDSLDIDAIRKFEVELYHLQHTPSTHSNKIIFRHQKELLKMRDYSREWQGFENLFQQLNSNN